MLNKLTQLIRLPIGRILPVMMVFFFAGGGFYIKNSGLLNPGPVSGTHPRNEPKGGYVSHAEFEDQCSHCHAPVHCVTDTRCQDCHIEIARQRSESTGLHALLPGTDQCQSCHTEHKGREVVITEMAFANIDHFMLAGFSLQYHTQDYQSQPLNCDSCHLQDRFLSETLDCISCHTDADHEAMAEHIETYGTFCLDCHDGTGRMRDFDHNQVYVLDGGHTGTDCNTCHLDQRFSTAPEDCAGCHEDPLLHLGLFGQDCVRCHTTQAWAPAQLTQHTFLLSHGSSNITACETCHAGSYTEYPCYTCHEDLEMQTLHFELDIQDTFENCVECHPSGRAVEANAAQLPITGKEGTSDDRPQDEL